MRVPLEPQTCLHDLVAQNPAVWQKSRRLSCVDTDPALSLPLELLCDNTESNSLAGLVKDWPALTRVDALESDSFFASLVHHSDRVAIMYTDNSE